MFCFASSKNVLFSHTEPPKQLPADSVIKANVGTALLIDMSERFEDPESLAYSATGLTYGSGLKFDDTYGVLYGTPKTSMRGRVDEIVVTATNARGSFTTQSIKIQYATSELTFVQTTKIYIYYVYVLCKQQFTTLNSLHFVDNQDPQSIGLEPLTMYEGEDFTFDVSKSFSDPDGDKLSFYQKG